MNRAASFFILLGLSIYIAQAQDNSQTEIIQLIERVETSGCLFHRNGNTHPSADAADHLRLKLRRGAKYARTTESFIENLASQSSWSKKPYYIECKDEEKIIMNSWLNRQLAKIRG